MRRPVRPTYQNMQGYKDFKDYSRDLRAWRWTVACTWIARGMWGVFALLVMFADPVPQAHEAKHIINDRHHYSQAPK